MWVKLQGWESSWCAPCAEHLVTMKFEKKKSLLKEWTLLLYVLTAWFDPRRATKHRWSLICALWVLSNLRLGQNRPAGLFFLSVLNKLMTLTCENDGRLPLTVSDCFHPADIWSAVGLSGCCQVRLRVTADVLTYNQTRVIRSSLCLLPSLAHSVIWCLGHALIAPSASQFIFLTDDEWVLDNDYLSAIHLPNFPSPVLRPGTSDLAKTVTKGMKKNKQNKQKTPVSDKCSSGSLMRAKWETFLPLMSSYILPAWFCIQNFQWNPFKDFSEDERWILFIPNSSKALMMDCCQITRDGSFWTAVWIVNV